MYQAKGKWALIAGAPSALALAVNHLDFHLEMAYYANWR